MNRLANPKDGGQYSFYYTVIKGWQDVADGKATTVSGITTPDDKTIVFHLTKPTGDFNLRMSMPATAPIPKEVGDCFEGKPGDYGRNVISSGPYMIKGSDGHVLVVQRPQAVQRLRRRQRQPHRARPQPELRPVDRPVPEELSGPVPVPGQLERGRHLRAGCRGQARRRAVEPAAEDDPAIRDGSDPEAAPAVERRRPHLVPDDEPDAGTVRRHPRAQGDEPDHGQERPAQGLGRPGARLDRDAHRAARDVQQRARRVRPVRDAQRSGRRRQGRCRDEAVEVLRRQRQVHRLSVQERADDRGHPRRSTTA